MRLNRSSLLARLYRDRPGFILLHVPKTGGSSLASAIRRHYRWSNFNVRAEASALAAAMLHGADPQPDPEVARQDLRASLVFYAAAQGVRFITGHVWYHPRMAALREYGYETVTLLRHPVDRWYSHYFYGRFKEGSHARIDADFEEFLESAPGREAGVVYTRYFSRSPAAGPEQGGAVELAKRRLEEVGMVGILEDLPVLERAFSERYGLSLQMPHKRRSPARKHPSHLLLVRKYKESREWRARVEALCRPDIELYEHARSRVSVRA